MPQQYKIDKIAFLTEIFEKYDSYFLLIIKG